MSHSTLSLMQGTAGDAGNAEAKDPIVNYRRAQWSWISGRRKAAAQQMGAFALAAESGPLREIASRAYAELALWSVMSGDRDGAARLAQKALSIAGPASAGNAMVARFLAQPPAGSSEWAVRAEQQFPGPAQGAIKNFSLAYALLINQQFQPAMLLFKQMWEAGSPTADEGLPVPRPLRTAEGATLSMANAPRHARTINSQLVLRTSR